MNLDRAGVLLQAVARAGEEARRLAESRYGWDGQAGLVDDLLHRVTTRPRVTSRPR